MDHTLQLLDQIKNDLLANTCNANEAKDRLFAIIGTPHNIVAQSIYDLQNTDCTNLYLHLEHEGQSRKLMNLFEDFLAEDHKKSFNITRARFFELYMMITVDILDYSKHSYNFFDQAKEEILNTDDVENGLSKVRDELQDLLYIVYDFSEIDKYLEDEIKSMYESTKRLQDQFKNNIDNRAKNHAQDIEIKFEEDYAYCVEYLDKIKEVLEVIHKNEELEKLSITFQYKDADTEMEEFMLKIAIMVEQFNSSRK